MEHFFILLYIALHRHPLQLFILLITMTCETLLQRLHRGLFRIRQEYGNLCRLTDSLYRLDVDPRRGALPDLIWPYKWVCTAEQGMVFFTILSVKQVIHKLSFLKGVSFWTRILFKELMRRFAMSSVYVLPTIFTPKQLIS